MSRIDIKAAFRRFKSGVIDHQEFMMDIVAYLQARGRKFTIDRHREDILIGMGRVSGRDAAKWACETSQARRLQIERGMY